MPVIIATPAIIAALILLTYSLRLFEAYRPRWTKPFVQEAKEKAGDLDPEPTHPSLTATLSLLAIAAVGLASQILTVFLPTYHIVEIYPSIAWVSRFSFNFGTRLMEILGHCSCYRRSRASENCSNISMATIFHTSHCTTGRAVSQSASNFASKSSGYTSFARVCCSAGWYRNCIEHAFSRSYASK
jgi:hypothetical protein